MNAAKAISTTSRSNNNRGCLVIFGLIFFVAGSAFFYFVMLRPLMRTVQARNWVTGQATIERSQVVTHQDSDGATYSADIAFRYNYNDQDWQSTTWSTGVGNGSRSSAEAIVELFPVGAQPECYINPHDPSQAVLDRSFQSSNLFGLFSLLFILIGGGVAWAGLRSGRERTTPATLANERNDWNEDQDDEDDDDDDDETSRLDDWDEIDAPWLRFVGPQKLKPTHGRLTAFFGTLFVAAFWNGISWLFFYNAWKDGQWIAIAFLTLFVVIGAVLIVACVTTFLKLFNPIITVALSEGAVVPGEPFDIAWETTGVVRVIKELRLSIIGEQVVTYVRGTTTSTDRKIFQRIPLSSVTSETEMRFGSTTASVPVDTMHSFEAPNNKIVWSIHVQGRIPFWPDVDERLPFAIRPLSEPASAEELT